MKITIHSAIVAAVLAVVPVAMRSQVTVTTSADLGGTIDQFAPGSELIVRSETAPAPIRYTISKQTVFVDEAGAPVAVERLSPGVPVRVETIRTGDRVVASRVIVHSAPVVEKVTRTTTTTRTLTREEREQAEKVRKAEEEYAKKVREAEEERNEKVRKAAKD